MHLINYDKPYEMHKMTPLMEAAKCGDAKEVKKLVEPKDEKGNLLLDINEELDGFTAIMHATYANNPDIVKILVELKDDNGKQLVHLFYKRQTQTLIREPGSFIQIVTKHPIESIGQPLTPMIKLIEGLDQSLLSIAASHGYIEILDMLIDFYPRCERIGDLYLCAHEDALMFAVKNDQFSAIQTLLKRRDKDGNLLINIHQEYSLSGWHACSALTLAAHIGHKRSIETILEPKDKNGAPLACLPSPLKSTVSPLDDVFSTFILAIISGHEQIVHAILQPILQLTDKEGQPLFNVHSDSVICDGEIALTAASLCPKSMTMEALLKLRDKQDKPLFDIKKEVYYCYSRTAYDYPLAHSVYKGSFHQVNSILKLQDEQGKPLVHINAKNSEDKTALDQFNLGRHREPIGQILLLHGALCNEKNWDELKGNKNLFFCAFVGFQKVTASDPNLRTLRSNGFEKQIADLEAPLKNNGLTFTPAEKIWIQYLQERAQSSTEARGAGSDATETEKVGAGRDAAEAEDVRAGATKAEGAGDAAEDREIGTNQNTLSMMHFLIGMPKTSPTAAISIKSWYVHAAPLSRVSRNWGNIISERLIRGTTQCKKPDWRPTGLTNVSRILPHSIQRLLLKATTEAPQPQQAKKLKEKQSPAIPSLPDHSTNTLISDLPDDITNNIIDFLMPQSGPQ